MNSFANVGAIFVHILLDSYFHIPKFRIMKIAVANGDGIGPEIMEAVLKIFDANKVPLEYEFVEMGKWVFDKGYNNGMTPEAK